MRVCLLDPASGKVLRYMKAKDAEQLVDRGSAERKSETVIVLNAPSVSGRSFMPTFDEVRADSSRWAGRKRQPQLDVDKQDFLRAMRRLSA